MLDTNVLMHDPTAIFRFEEHDVFLPMVVLEELDAHKKGLSEQSRNVRQVSRFLDDLMRGVNKDQIDRGPEAAVRLLNGNARQEALVRPTVLPDARALRRPAAVACRAARTTRSSARRIALQKENPDARVVLVSKDINLRIKAAVLGVHAEDYYSDKTLEDRDVLYSGMAALPANFWESHGKDMRSWKEGDRTFYEITGPAVREWQMNEFVYEDSPQGIEAIVRKVDGERATLELTRDYRSERHSVWGITARNREQNFALNLLMDPEIDLVTVLGPAGTGKTLLTLAAGLMQTLETNRFVEIIMTRVTIPLGEDIGFLPGTEEEKMEPWMGALMDNLEVLTQSHGRRQLGPRGHQRPAAQPHQDPLAQLHARAHVPEPLHHPRRGAEPDAEADEGADHARGPGHQDRVPGQHRADRYAVPHGDDLGPHLFGEPVPRAGRTPVTSR